MADITVAYAVLITVSCILDEINYDVMAMFRSTLAFALVSRYKNLKKPYTLVLAIPILFDALISIIFHLFYVNRIQQVNFKKPLTGVRRHTGCSTPDLVQMPGVSWNTLSFVENGQIQPFRPVAPHPVRSAGQEI